MQRRRRNALGGVAVLALALGVVAGAGSGGSADPAASRAARAPAKTLPGGGRTIIPGRRVVAFYGAPQDRELGILGIGSPQQAGRKLLRQARAYRSPRERLLPAMELIATVVNRSPGGDGRYRTRLTDAVIRRYLHAARAIGALLILDIQPGRADFPTEARVLEQWLREPDVSLALDPEWRMLPGQVPGQVIGSVQAGEVDQVSRWLAGVVRDNGLPQKLLVIHQFTANMVANRLALQRVPGVQTVLDGFKLFYKEDSGVMSPRQVEALAPRPRFIIYE